MTNHYLILGVKNNSSQSEIDSAFKKLRIALAAQDFSETSSHREQARSCLDSFEKAYQVLSSPDSREEHDRNLDQSQTESKSKSTKPRIGQLCVASGIITVDQLEDVVQEQIKTGLPLGEILENKHYVSRQELEGLLMGQDLIDLDDDIADPLANRIIALDLITDDMLLIAHMETKAQGASLINALVRRGWVSKQLMEILTSS